MCVNRNKKSALCFIDLQFVSAAMETNCFHIHIFNGRCWLFLQGFCHCDNLDLPLIIVSVYCVIFLFQTYFQNCTAHILIKDRYFWPVLCDELCSEKLHNMIRSTRVYKSLLLIYSEFNHYVTNGSLLYCWRINSLYLY